MRAEIKVIRSIIFICPECDAVWFKIEEVGVVPYRDYATYMKGIGLAGLWEELEEGKLNE